MTPKETIFQTGEIIADRYEIADELGRGSYGVVFRAIQLGIDRQVAIKTLLPQTAVDSEEHQRFEREALLISRLNHPNIITLFDYGEHNGVLFMVMEYVEGRSLGDMIEAEAPVSPELARALSYQMLDALQFAHDQGVVHRDLKPENIRLIRNPSIEGEEKESLKILDFGIAKFVHGDVEGSPLDTLTQSGIALGTPQYMSPENVTGDPVTRHADLYAVGLILYEMLTGEPAFTGENPHVVMVAHVRDDPPQLPDVAEMRPFVRALEWSLRKQPDERVPSARAMRELLEQDAPVLQIDAVATGPPGRSDASKNAMIAVMLAALVVITLLVLIVVQDEGVTQPQVITQVVYSQDPVREEVPVDEGEEPDESGEEEMIIEAGELDDEWEQPERSSEVDDEVMDEQVVDSASDGPNDQNVGSDEDEDGEVELVILSEPANARITIDGRPVGTSPLSQMIQQSTETVEIGFSLIGYRDTVMDVVPDRAQTVETRLERGRLELVP